VRGVFVFPELTMSQNQLTDHNATPLNDGSGLRGGTEHGSAVPPVVNDRPSTPASGSPAGGTTAPAGGGHGLPEDAADPTEAMNRLADGTRHGSAAEAAREARSAASAPTRSGFNPDDPANERREDSSDGTHASTSGRKLGEPGAVARTDG
jgi:hypothetical protein